VLVLSRGKACQQIAHGVIARRLRRAPVEARSLVFHFLGELANGVEPERAVEPDRTARDEAFHVLPPDQRQKFAKFLPVEVEHAASRARKAHKVSKRADESETGHCYRSEPEAGGLDSGRFGGLGEPPLFNGKGYDQNGVLCCERD
jgi:hypothetical protein